jgi:pSer/pThr/pTyr-binding forkhead associated (FHA) protein
LFTDIHPALGGQPLMLNCRDCPIRERCIQESNTAPSVKLMMRRAFEAERDTHDMWGLLQNNCLLEKEDGAQAIRSTVLRQRLRGEPEPGELAEAVEQAGPAPPAPPVGTGLQPPSVVAVREPAREVAPARRVAREKTEEGIASLRYCLSLQDAHHRIALPRNGEIVLGRFDPTIDVTPDVDLSYDDREHFVISRRHALIIGHDGWHEIEDLGSTNGSRVNGRRLEIGQRVRMQLGDQIALGYCSFVYAPIPEMPALPYAAPLRAYLWGAFTGHRFPLPAWGEVIVGRSDPVVDLAPDIDLSGEGDAAHVIARRHIKIIASDGRHYVEDLGSANGAKLNGVRMRISELRLLGPGDHLWLGGCVLAYDIQL